jgi:peptidoglycan/xylan/chitin deacetylase (PgdA/CDA1 family)
MKTHGDQNWESYPTYFDIFIPLVLEILDSLGQKITFFMVGQDAALEKNKKFISLISKYNHEIGNHSYSHEPWLHLYEKKKIYDELIKTDREIKEVTGIKPIGFRGPGFSWSNDLLEVLNDLEYLYDASSLPTYLGPLARLYYFWKSDLSTEEKEKRKMLFGSFTDGFKKNRPYFIKLPSGKRMLEIPVTTMPILKVPFHLSYLLYLGGYSKPLMRLYLKTAITMCKIFNVGISFLLHPLDLLGGDKVSTLKFFPGMNINTENKIAIFREVLMELKKHFNVFPMNEYAKIITEQK